MSHILLIDDSVGLLSSMCDLLEHHGHIVETASTRQEAYAAASENLSCGTTDFDVIVCDWDLGPLQPDGATIVTHLRDDYYPNARYIIYSGDDRAVPEGVEFFSKADLIGLINALEEK